MSIRTSCPQCEAVFNLAEQYAGKHVRCKKCENVFAVATAAYPKSASTAVAAKNAALPAPPLRAPEETERRRPVRTPALLDESRRGDGPREANRFPVGWLVGGGIAFLLIAGSALAYALTRDSSPKSTAQADALDGKVKRDLNQPPILPQAQKQPDPVENVQPRPQPQVPARPERKKEPPLRDPIEVAVAPAPPVVPAEPKAVAPPPANDPAWKVKADPLPQAVEIPDGAKGAIPVAGLTQLAVFPSVPSPFVLAAQEMGASHAYEVWDLRTFKKTGGLTLGNERLADHCALSSDGAFVASKVGIGFQPNIDVWSAADGKRLAHIAADDGKSGIVHLVWVDFVGSGQLITAKSVKFELVFQIWDVKTGAEVRQFTASAPTDRKQIAVSAGRKYVAVFHKNKDRVLIYDLSTGTLAGEARLAKDTNFLQCQGLAFSPDGTTLASVFSTGIGGRIVSWDLANGEVKADQPYKQNLQQMAANGFFYKGPALEWLNDSSGFVAFGQLLIDAVKGNVFWKIPGDGLDGNQRRLFGMSRLARVKGDIRARTLTFDVLPADQIAAALKSVQAGEDPAATKLPALKSGDWSTLRNLPGAGAAAAWKATADPAPAGKQLKKSFPLNGKGSDVARILFSAPDVGQTAVLSAAGSDIVLRKQVRADRYDLTTGKHLGGLDLFAAEAAQGQQFQLDADFSPDGAALAVKEPKDGKRVDIWSLADGKHIAGWLPFEKEGDPVIRWLGFLDAQRLLTLNAAGKLILWQVPECRAVWALDGCRAAPAVSAGRKYLAVFNGPTIELLDAAGERQGTLAGLGIHGIFASAFRADGKEFAAVIQSVEGGTTLARWKTTTGESLGEFPIPIVSNDVYRTELKWCGTDFLMLQNNLIDPNLKWMTVTGNISGTGRHATGSPDGRHWFAASTRPDAPPILAGQTFPDDVSKALAQGVAAKTIQPVLSPGTTVSVRVAGAGPAGDPEFHKRIAANLTKKLQAHGLKVADQAPATFVVTFQPERDTGKKITFRMIGAFPRKPDTIVPILEVACEANLTDGGGGAIWERKFTIRTPEPFGIVRSDDVAATLSKQMWQHCQNWGSSVAMPASMVRTSTGVESLPKPVLLTGDR